jgi:hypothetical protein
LRRRAKHAKEEWSSLEKEKQNVIDLYRKINRLMNSLLIQLILSYCELCLHIAHTHVIIFGISMHHNEPRVGFLARQKSIF